MDFGERLKQLRKDAGLTQDSIAEKLGVHNQTVSKWERGLLQPDISLLGNLADALGVSMEKLLDCKEGEQTFKGTFSTTQLGQSIAKNRIIKSESQQALATALGVSADTVSHWERGQTMPSAITLCAIAEHFDVPVSELYYGAKDDELSPVVINVKKRRPIIALIAGLSACLVISVIFAVLGIAGVFGKKDVMFTITVNGETISVKENTFYSPEKPEHAVYLGRLSFNILFKIEVTNPIIIPASVKELGDFCFEGFIGKVYFAENSCLERIGDYAFFCTLYNTLILPDSVTTLGSYIAHGIDIVLPKSLKYLKNRSVLVCKNVFFPEGISNSLRYTDTIDRPDILPDILDYHADTEYYCAETEKAALDKLLAANNSIITLKAINKRELTLDYGTRTEKVNDYYAILPDISDENTALLGWISEFNGNEKVFFPERMFISDTLTTVKAKTVKRSAHDGLTAETAAEIDPTEKNYEMFISFHLGKIYQFFFTLKTDKPILIKVAFTPIYTTIEFEVFYKNKQLPTCSFEYKPGEILNLCSPDEGVVKVTMNVEIIDL